MKQSVVSLFFYPGSPNPDPNPTSDMPTLTLAKNPPELVVKGRRSSRIPKAHSQRKWFLVHTKSRQEKVVAQALRDQRQSYYLPLEKYKTLSARRTIIAARPMFSGYLFAHGLPSTIYDLYRSPTCPAHRPIVSLTEVKDPILLTQQLRALYAITSQQNPYEGSITFQKTQSFQPGQEIEFKWPSPLQGQRATIAQQTKPNLIQVNAGLLGAAVFEVDLQKHPIKLLNSAKG